MVQFSSVVAQFSCIHIEIFATGLDQFGSVGLLKLIVGVVTRKLGKRAVLNRSPHRRQKSASLQVLIHSVNTVLDCVLISGAIKLYF